MKICLSFAPLIEAVSLSTDPTEEICKELPTEEEKTKEDIKLINDIEEEIKEDKEVKEELVPKVIQEVTQQVEQSTDEFKEEDQLKETRDESEVNETETETEVEIEEKEEELSEEEMLRSRRTRQLLAPSCAPPTYARQPPDGREITMSYMDGQSAKSVNPTISYDLFQTPNHGREDSGVFIDTDTPSPELDYNHSLTRNSLSNATVSRIKYKPNLNGDNSSDADTGITSLSSDSMDELDSCSLPVSHYRLNKQIIEKSRIPSSDFLNETALNGSEQNGSLTADQISSRESSERSVREKIAMFDTQESSDGPTTSSKSLGSVKSDLNYNYNSLPLNGKTDISSDRLSSSDGSDLLKSKKIHEKSNESQNGSVYSTKSLFIHKKSSSLISETPQSPVPQYSGHLQPSYVRYSSLGSQNDSSLQNSQFSGIGVHRPLTNGNLLSSILETRKQNASKLKGLIIPDVPMQPQPAVSKPLPTILSNTSTSSLLLTSKPEETLSLSQRSHVQSQLNSLGNFSAPVLASQQPPSLPESISLPPWSINSPNIPKYSPAFKRRQLELPRSLSLLNNSVPDRTDIADSLTPSFNRSNSMTQMNANDSQFQFSLSHSKPVVPPVPETADGMAFAKSTPSLDQQLALSVNDSYRHSSVQRRYSADVFNYNNSLKFSLEKRSSADSTNNLYKSPIAQTPPQNEISHSSDRSPVLNNKLYHSMSYFENKGRPSLSERTNHKVADIDYPLQRNIFSYNLKPIHQSISLNNKQENGFNRSMDKTFVRSLIHSDYSDDDSSTISHKTSEDSSVRADDSDTTSDSMDQSFSPELNRPKVLGTQLTVLRNSMETEKTLIRNDSTSESVKNFRALAEQWEQRSGSESLPPMKSVPPPLPPKPNSSASRMPPSLMPRNKSIPPIDSVSIEPKAIETKQIEPIFCAKTEIKNLENTLKQIELEDEKEASKTSFGSLGSLEPTSRSDSLSSDSSSDQSIKSCSGSVGSLSRSVSDICKVFESNGSESPSQSRSSRSPSLNSIKTITNNDTKCMIDVEEDDKKAESTQEENNDDNHHNHNDINDDNNDDINDNINDEVDSKSDEKTENWDKTAEKEEPVLTHHQRMSSIDSLASDSGASSSGVAVRSLGMRTSSASNLRDSQYGSVSSLASSTSLISPQELQQLIEEANQSLEANDINSHNIQVVVLHREYKTSGSIGITLAGGSDCETKEITVRINHLFHLIA